MLTNIFIAICLLIQLFSYAVCGMNVQKAKQLEELFPNFKKMAPSLLLNDPQLRFIKGQSVLAFWSGNIFLSIAVYLLITKGNV